MPSSRFPHASLQASLALRDPRLPSTARLVQLILAGNEKDGQVVMLQRDLLEITNLDPRTYRKAVAALEDLGYLAKTGRAGLTPIYQLSFPRGKE